MSFDIKTQLTIGLCKHNAKTLRLSIPEAKGASAREITSIIPTTHTIALEYLDRVFLGDKPAGLVCVGRRQPERLSEEIDTWKEVVEVGL